MEVRISETDNCAVPNFVITAKTPCDVALLRQWSRYGYASAPQRLFLHSYGGRIDRTEESICFGWRAETDFQPKATPAAPFEGLDI